MFSMKKGRGLEPPSRDLTFLVPRSLKILRSQLNLHILFTLLSQENRGGQPNVARYIVHFLTPVSMVTTCLMYSRGIPQNSWTGATRGGSLLAFLILNFLVPDRF